MLRKVRMKPQSRTSRFQWRRIRATQVGSTTWERRITSSAELRTRKELEAALKMPNFNQAADARRMLADMPSK